MSACVRDDMSALPKMVGAAKPYSGHEKRRRWKLKADAMVDQKGQTHHHKPWPNPLHDFRWNFETPKNPLQSRVRMT